MVMMKILIVIEVIWFDISTGDYGIGVFNFIIFIGNVCFNDEISNVLFSKCLVKFFLFFYLFFYGK